MTNRSIMPRIFDQSSNSFREFNRALQDLERSFDFFWKETPFMSGTRREMIQPNIDIIENDKEIQIIADLPGLTEKDINIEIKKDSFTLTGEKKQEKEEDEGNYHILERSRGYFSRTFQLPNTIDESKAEATLHDGVLKIVLPKSAEAEAHRRKIEIKRE